MDKSPVTRYKEGRDKKLALYILLTASIVCIYIRPCVWCKQINRFLLESACREGKAFLIWDTYKGRYIGLYKGKGGS